MASLYEKLETANQTWLKFAMDHAEQSAVVLKEQKLLQFKADCLEHARAKRQEVFEEVVKAKMEGKDIHEDEEEKLAF